jgi:hypothetical protein
MLAHNNDKSVHGEIRSDQARPTIRLQHRCSRHVNVIDAPIDKIVFTPHAL